MRQPTYNESYDLKETLAVACAVFRHQGFIKSNEGYWDPILKIQVSGNRNAVLMTLRRAEGHDIGKDVTFAVEEQDRNHAEVVFQYFDQRLLMGKIGDNLTPYDQDLSRPFETRIVLVRRDLGRIASLPNSYVTAKHREKLQVIYDENKQVGGFVGSPKERLKIEADVVDVKFLPKQDSHIITAMTDEQRLVKFFIGSQPSDIASSVENKRITFIGTVRDHEVSSFSGCHETIFNRVKFLD